MLSSLRKIKAKVYVAWYFSEKLVVHCTLSGLVSAFMEITYSITCSSSLHRQLKLIPRFHT